MNRIVVIAGPTAVGKTKMAIHAAKAVDGEIVSCDSMQLYKFMDIGSAKPTAEEIAQVRHHLVDVIDPRDNFSVAQYQKMAKDAIFDILDRGKMPVVSGGTGLYLNSLLYDMDFSMAPDDLTYREHLETVAREEGGEALHRMLSELDPEAAEGIHPNNVRKLIRALERINMGEDKIKQFSDVKKETEDYEVILIGLTRDRKELYDRINKRVDLLVGRGLFDEVERLMEMGLTRENISMKGIGYKESMDYIDGACSREDAINTIKKNTRHYAKKQLTWFRRYDKMKWYDISCFDSDNHAAEEITSWILKELKKSR